ncbi:MAG: hypothetical protein IJW45_03560 [Oscillospiraceae bacterium]|nr:hypothetical protein [Oscillospiraceae bacterium]
MERLIGTRFNRIYRCLDMMCLDLGEDLVFFKLEDDHDTAPQRSPQFSLHFQTQWRFLQNDTILLGSRDIYEPFCETVDDDWRYDIPGRPDEESSVFDVKRRLLTHRLTDSHVTNATVSPVGDVLIRFSNGIQLMSFTPASRVDEEWRLIDFAQDEHIIFREI